MKLTRKQLKTIVENYLIEQDDVLAGLEDEEAPEQDSEPSGGSEDPVETPAADEEPVEAENVEAECDFDKIKSFRVKTPDSPQEGHKVQFKKDSASDKIIVLIDDKKFTSPKTSDMVALAGLGLTTVEDENTQACLLKVVQMDRSFDGKSIKVASEFIKRKIDGSRFPFVNFKGLIKKAIG